MRGFPTGHKDSRIVLVLTMVFLLTVLNAWQPLAAFGACTVPLFTEAPDSPFAVGNDPQYGAVGDFNGDDKLDLVAVNEDEDNDDANDTVSVLLGNGDGSFGPQATFTVGVNPASVAVGYLNGDDDLDLVVANNATGSEGTISVLLGNGIGGFALLSTFGNGGPSNSVALGDFNKDGDMDLVVAEEGRVRLGNGDGTFDSATNVAPGVFAGFVTVGYVNCDEDLDLVLAQESGSTITVVLGNGDGTFNLPSSFTAGNGPSSAALGDFDLDGDMDIALANEGDTTISVLLGNCGSFGSEINYIAGEAPSYVAVGDVNGDGVLDLIAANEEGGTISILLGTGDGSFGPQATFIVGEKPAFVAVGDYNGDGALDLAVINEDTDDITVLLNQCLPVICRTAGFWGTHAGEECKKKEGDCGSQNITQAVINACEESGGGCLEICGESIMNTDLDSGNSALEAMCVSPLGDQRLQLARQLTATALNCCISVGEDDCEGIAEWQDVFIFCNSVCALNMSDSFDYCVKTLDCLNKGGNPLQLNNPGFFCQTGTCEPLDTTGTDQLFLPCNEESGCPIGYQCVSLSDTCHDRELCNENLGLCFERPGPAGSTEACTLAKGDGKGKKGGDDCAILPMPNPPAANCSKFNQGEECCGSDDEAVCEVCAHDVCETGVGLDLFCDPCVTAVCLEDPFCCDDETGEWDSKCVLEAVEICGISCLD